MEFVELFAWCKQTVRLSKYCYNHVISNLAIDNESTGDPILMDRITQLKLLAAWHLQ